MSNTKDQAGKTDNLKKRKEFDIKNISPGSFFSEPAYLEEQFVLAAPEMPFTRELIETLDAWDFFHVYSSGEPMKDYAGYTDDAEGAFIDTSIPWDSEKISKAEKFYAAFLKYVESVFTQVVIKNTLDFNAIAERIRAACDIIREDRQFLLAVQKAKLPNPTDNYLASHAAKSAIISLVIGNYLKLPAHRLIELGVAALLHEIGMIKLPPQVYLAKRPLQPQERKAIHTHPVLGFNMLKSFDFPLAVTLPALDHHERENSSGYPRKLAGDGISLYSKIIAVACSYEALSSHRPHKEAKDGYTGMLELLKNEGKQYDDTVIRALVFSLSIYPIGLYVLLSSGRSGQVVDVNPENPRFPIVQIFGEQTPDGKNKVAGTSQDGLYIVRPLTKEEIKSESPSASVKGGA